jgi:polysaccharide biosynthesis/export protein
VFKFVQLAIIALLLSMVAINVGAATPSPAMIEQFKKLPKAQQEQLAKQYGISLSDLRKGTGDSEAKYEDTEELEPRKRQEEKAIASDQIQQKPPAAKRFGLQLFDEKISTFAPVHNMPVPDSYLLGAGDSIQVQLYGKNNDQLELIIDRDGRVMLPDLAPIQLAGLSFGQARELISERVSQAIIGTQAAVSMGKLRTINVFIAGEAKNPGMYAVSAMTTVTQALFVAGGVSDIGSLRHISVNRAGKRVTSFDLYQLLLKGDNSNDVNLQHGDVVFVAPISILAEVTGEVRRSAIYEVFETETVSDLLNMAGGIKANAYANAVALERVAQSNRREIQTLDLSNANDRNIKLRNGDVLRLDSISARVQNQVTLVGAVVRPGKYAWQDGMHISNLIQSIWTDLLLSTDLDYALVLRESNRKGDLNVLQFNLAQALEQNNSADISLMPRDIVVVFHHSNQSYQREKLNSYIREQLTDTLTTLTDTPELAGDIASRAFDVIMQENTLLLKADEDKKPITQLDIKELTQSRLQLILQSAFTEHESLLLTPHLTRKELMFPILERLKQQSSNQQNIQIVSISGDVKVPGEYPLVYGGGVTELISAAGGLTASAFLSRAELSRYKTQSSGQNQIIVEHQSLDIGAILQDPANDIALQSRDRLNIFTTPDWSMARKVKVEGEVRFPGEYSILKGETLQDVLIRAGGFTQDAFVFGAVFTREQIRKREQEQMSRLIEQLKADVATRSLSAEVATTSPTDAFLMISELEKQQPIGRLVVNLEQIQAGNPEYNLALEDGDRLVVPRKNRTVSVIGEVQLASTHRFDASLDVRRYLQLAGGYRKRADENRVYVIRADGSVFIPNSQWFSVNQDGLKPGDTIVVPVDTDYKDSLSLWTQVTQIFYQSAVAVAALKSF